LNLVLLQSSQAAFQLLAKEDRCEHQDAENRYEARDSRSLRSRDLGIQLL